MTEEKKTNLSPSKGEIPTEEDIRAVLMAVVDPELQVNIVDLGLIYKIHRDPKEGRITVDMTLTTPACPYGPALMSQTHAVLFRLPNVKDVKIQLVWTPQWDPRKHATEDAQMMLGLL